VSESTAQQLFDLLQDAKPKGGPRHSKPAPKPEIAKLRNSALKAIRFSVQLPELGGAIEMSPHLGFEPVYCLRCGALRENKQYGRRTFGLLPCACTLVIE